ncbi:MAG: T9SS type A sorting domain-containing protein, partial [Bacteroidota bacterium]
WPSKLIGGKVNLGIAANYPSNALPLTAFTMLACKADGAGGLPGTIIDSVMVTPYGFGWADFSFASPITINSGDFYLVMKQGGIPPHAAGIGFDVTTNKFRSYSCFVTGGAPWVPESGNFMIRAIIQGAGGPLLGDNSTGNKELITASSVEGLIYQSPVAKVSGYEGVARTEPFDWSAMQNTNFAPQITAPVATVQPATDEGVGSNIVGVVIPTEAPSSVLYDNGPLITSTGTGFGGADESMVQAPLTGYGNIFNHASYGRVADDFSLSGNSYNVTSIEFYGYQTGSTTTSTFTAAYCRILNGNPSLPGSTVVWGDTTTNRLSSTSFTNIYRVSVTLNNQRPIMKIVINTPGLTLPAGNYWIEFATLGSLASGPWCPYVTINNTPTTGNALYYGGTTAGYTPILSGSTFPQGVPFIINGTQASSNNLSYQVWRFKQGQEGNLVTWMSIWVGSATSTVDNGWSGLPSGPYRWAVKAIYSPPGQRPSAPTFSNVIGKDWLANVTVNVSLNCADDPLIGSVVKLVNNNYPDTAYMATTDTNGKVIFAQVWKGNYTLSVMRLNYDNYSQSLDVMGDLVVTPNPIILLQTKNPPTDLIVNNQSLKATWNRAKSDFYQLDENFNGGFTTNEWAVSGGANWQISTTLGNPASSAMFYFQPNVTDYHQYLTSKSLSGVHAPQMKLQYDVCLDNFGTTTLNELAVELWNGATWTTLKTYNNMGGNIPWTTEAIDITAQTHNPAFKIRFHASGVNSVDIINWNIDNVKVISSNVPGGGNSCLIGYGVYLNNVQLGFTMDTNYQIQPNQVFYGQTNNFCVKAAYQSGYSLPVCVNFSSNFLYPPTSLVATEIQSTAYLTWNKPQVMGDAQQILSITPKAVNPNSIADIAPFDIVTTKPANVDNGDVFWDLKFSWAAATNQETGVVCIGDFIYTSSWSLSGGSTNWFHKYNKTTGAMIEQFDIPGITGVRDFAFDGINAYATGYTNTISKIDLAAHTVISTLVTSGVGNIRHIAYDPVNNGFWVGDWTTIFLVDATTGAVVATGPAMLNAYGSAYDPDPAGPFLWVHAQNGAPLDQLQQFKITGTTLTATGVVMNVGTLAGFPTDGSAGGLETVTHAGKFCLLGAVQNLNWIFAVELRDSIPGENPGLIGYNIYRDNTLIHYNPHPDSTFYFDTNLNPGIYRYDVSAKYDLSSFGFPGQFGESEKEGPDTLIIGLKMQQIALTEGWNMISFNVVPDTLDLLNILQPLVNSNNLVKVIDEAGNIIQYFPWGWVNNIGDMAITEGYYIKVNSDDTLAVSGFTAFAPCSISLIAGWNMIGYPPQLQQDALVAVQQLISSGELVKVIDESGNIIQNLPWGWVNNIGNFKPGEGYYINVSAACTLTLNNPSSKLPIVIPAKISEPTHFTNCFTRNPYMPMAFGIVVGLSGNEGIEPGDEFAVFDGSICVGSIVVTKDMGNHVMIAGSADDPTTINLDGFTEGDKITFRFWDRSLNIEYENCAVNYLEGNQTFAQKGTYIGEIDLFTGADETLSSGNTYLLQNTPNPFNGFTEIKYGIGRNGKVTLSIYNAMGILMSTIVDEFQKKGDHLVSFNSANLPSGIYYYQLEVSGYENRIVKTEKMIVTKY